MGLFTFDFRQAGDAFARDGYVHIPNGVTPDFLAHLTEYCRHLSSLQSLHGAGIRGAKQQHLYAPPPDVDLIGALKDLSRGMGVLDPGRFTLAERHIKWYDAAADPDHPAHKDRLASKVAIGISIEVPERSRLVLYPTVDRGTNPFLTTELHDSLPPDRRPEVLLTSEPSVEIHDQPGDVVVFPGSSMWHLRRDSANTVNLYLKCNDFDSDPLGEDPTTAMRREATLRHLEMATSVGLAHLAAATSRQLEWTGRIHGRDGVTRAFAKLWERPPTVLSESQFELLEHLVGPSSSNEQPAAVDAAMVELARLGLVDLFSAGTPPVGATA